MGSNYYLEVVGKLDLRDFIKDCLTRYEKEFASKYGDNYHVVIDTSNSIDRKKFFDNVILSFNDFQIQIGGPLIQNQDLNNLPIKVFCTEIDEDLDEDRAPDLSHWDNDDEYKNDPNDFITLIFFQVLLLAIDEKDPCLCEYLTVFDYLNGLKIKKRQTVKIWIDHISCYQGREKLDIDFLEIHNKIKKVKNLLPSINIYTHINLE